jgi:hypothetical protein
MRRRLTRCLPLTALLALAAISPTRAGGDNGDTSFGARERVEDALQGNIYVLPVNTRALPDFGRLTPVGTIYAKMLNVAPRDWREGFPGVTDRFEWFAIDYVGAIYVSRPGRYQFRIVSDDGSRLLVDGRQIIDNDGLHTARSMSGAADLDTGDHRIRVQYFQGPRFMVALQVYCTPPGGAERLFPDCDLTMTPPLKPGSR